MQKWYVYSRFAYVVGLLVALAAGCRQRPSALENARGQISIGTTREEAIETLGTTAWYHQPCPNLTTMTDLFFYGSHEYDWAEIVIVNSEPLSDTFVVYSINSFEPNAWHTAFRDCVQRERFED